MPKIRYGSVCSGVEAASLAWGPLGWEPVFFAEVEPFPCAVLQQRFNATKPLHPLDPADAADDKDRAMRVSWMKQINKLPDTGTVPNLGDFTKIKGADYVGAIDLLVGGTPCQDLSVAGKRAGFEGARSSLALDFVRLAYEARVKWFVWENVPGVFSSHGGADFATLLSLFVGYDIDVPKGGWKNSGVAKNIRFDRYGLAWRVLDAQYTRTSRFPFAVPQRRRRVFLVGCFGDWERSAEVLLEPGRMSWNPPTRLKKREILAGDTGNGVETASAIRMRAGCDGGGKGALIGDDLSHTLLNGNDQTVIEFGDVSSTIDASYYKGVDHKRQICLDQQVCANGTSFGQRKLEDVTGTVTTKESMVRGDTKLILEGKFWNGDEVAESLTCTSNNQRMPDKDRLQCVFTMDADSSNSMKSANPNSGFHEADVAKTLDTTVPTPQKAQGGQMIVGSFMGGQGAEAGGIGFREELSPTIKASPSGGNQVPDVVCCSAQGENNGAVTGTITGDHNSRSTDFTQLVCSPSLDASMYAKNQLQDLPKFEAVAIAENIIGRQEQNGGNGVGAQEELAYTQNATGVMGVASINCQGGSNINIGNEVTDTITAASNSSGNNKLGVMNASTVRRLLPLETDRLMSFPDNHTKIAWNGKSADECPDAPRYKACGNSMCVNVMHWIGQQIDNNEKEHK